MPRPTLAACKQCDARPPERGNLCRACYNRYQAVWQRANRLIARRDHTPAAAAPSVDRRGVARVPLHIDYHAEAYWDHDPQRAAFVDSLLARLAKEFAK